MRLSGLKPPFLVEVDKKGLRIGTSKASPPNPTNPARPGNERAMGHQPTSPSSMPTYQSHLASSVTNHEPPSLQERYLKRSPAHLSVCLRPTPSKRLKPTDRHHVGAASTTMSVSSTDLAARRSHRTRPNSTRHLSTSGGVKRANAEQWFNESNQNPTQAPRAPFIDSKLTMFPAIAEAQMFQMILRFIYVITPRQPWIVPVRFDRTGMPTAG